MNLDSLSKSINFDEICLYDETPRHLKSLVLREVRARSAETAHGGWWRNLAVGEGGFNPIELSALEAVQMTLFLTTCFGLVVAWRWQIIGGAISTGAMLLFLAVETGLTGALPKGVVFYLMLLLGILFMASGFIGRRGSAS